MNSNCTERAQRHAAKKRFFCGKRGAWEVVAVSLLLMVVINSENARGMDQIQLIAPASDIGYLQEVFQPVASKLHNDESINLHWNAAEFDSEHLKLVTRQIQKETNGPILWFGWPEDFVTQAYSSTEDSFQPEWVNSDQEFSGTDNVPDGVVALGAGWHYGTPDSPITLSLPREKRGTMPIVSIAIVSSEDSKDGRNNYDLVRAFTGILYGTEEGGSTLRSLTLLPALSNPQIASGRVTILFQPDWDDDGCDCDDHGFSPLSCDPDGDFPRSMLQLERRNHQVLAPGYKSSTDDDDGCDDCDESTAYRYSHVAAEDPTAAEELVAHLSERASYSMYNLEWEAHLDQLNERSMNGEIVTILACDPD